MTPQSIIDKYKVTPAQYPDLAAPEAKTADNIPGVPGVGDGFAAKWINQFRFPRRHLEHADEIGGKKGNHCGPISTRSNSIAKSTHWYETSI